MDQQVKNILLNTHKCFTDLVINRIDEYLMKSYAYESRLRFRPVLHSLNIVCENPMFFKDMSIHHSYIPVRYIMLSREHPEQILLFNILILQFTQNFFLYKDSKTKVFHTNYVQALDRSFLMSDYYYSDHSLLIIKTVPIPRKKKLKLKTSIIMDRVNKFINSHVRSYNEYIHCKII